MLNPPLSLLSYELLDYIVKHIAALPNGHKHLCNLSLADRAFTQFCQQYIFQTLQLGNNIPSKSRIPHTLKKMGSILNEKPSFATQVRVVQFIIPPGRNVWLFNDRTLIRILKMLAESPRPPHKLLFGWATIEDPITVVKRLTQSFFSQTLTTLILDECDNVPLPLFLVCPKLREVVLDGAGVTEESYDKYPDNQCSGREAPALELFNYRNSQSLVKQMVTPPIKFHTPVVLWSKLRVLTLCPHEKEEMACLQPILDAACNTLEELNLTRVQGYCRCSLFDEISKI